MNEEQQEGGEVVTKIEVERPKVTKETSNLIQYLRTLREPSVSLRRQTSAAHLQEVNDVRIRTSTNK
jgi:hypothetical protein